MKIYTKTGDKGTTSLLTGERINKVSIRVESYGTIDEINSALGLARALSSSVELKETICNLQKLLVMLMAELASANLEKPYITAEHVQQLEELIDKYDAKLPPLKDFIVPGDTPGAAALDLARTVARRAERQVWRLRDSEESTVSENTLIALNRLSDLCFTLSRFETQESIR
ncbi:MAG TPA: cob(I)yrinic acid a,c-diamide adenosyltransferase [Methylomusa anaerophila]|uniref:Corrinoid adenosyltransferase n=1 Tax=Methylomusa anaerophila TaxID=1930071 RepID=A0A348APJ5_9FIRM|nr:cob(I)yrinic acid a,c-diamide adenosyltransferase [Methylomusa anaerophila]BBB92993.1 Cob(I)yrinic acid a,c-diamide adenosyltransferase [Methylomusa anaerophila]HML87174.1 cob(I)yrinic acid a,c-diamide adenosyltransferase [Methylomusa anaerophila]